MGSLKWSHTYTLELQPTGLLWSTYGHRGHTSVSEDTGASQPCVLTGLKQTAQSVWQKTNFSFLAHWPWSVGIKGQNFQQKVQRHVLQKSALNILKIIHHDLLHFYYSSQTDSKDFFPKSTAFCKPYNPITHHFHHVIRVHRNRNMKIPWTKFPLCIIVYVKATSSLIVL